jgi:hypothetical protein
MTVSSEGRIAMIYGMDGDFANALVQVAVVTGTGNAVDLWSAEWSAALHHSCTSR